MKKDLFDKAIRLADKTTVRPEQVVIAKPNQQFTKKPPALVRSERLYARVTETEL